MRYQELRVYEYDNALEKDAVICEVRNTTRGRYTRLPYELHQFLLKEYDKFMVTDVYVSANNRKKYYLTLELNPCYTTVGPTAMRILLMVIFAPDEVIDKDIVELEVKSFYQ